MSQVILTFQLQKEKEDAMATICKPRGIKLLETAGLIEVDPKAGYTPELKDITKYVYNVEVFKRGKHHKNKHYDFYLYSIPMSLLNIVKMDIKQHHRNFTVRML